MKVCQKILARSLILLATVALLVGCQGKPEPKIKLSTEYYGSIFDEDRYDECLSLLIEQDGAEVTGKFVFHPQTGIQDVPGKLKGIVSDDEIKLELLVPLAWKREYSMSPTIQLVLKPGSASGKDAQAFLDEIGADTKAGSVEVGELSGEVKFLYFDKEITSPVRLVGVRPPRNPFNL